MKLEFLIINILIFIVGFLLGKILEKWRYQEKINKLFNESIKEINRIRDEINNVNSFLEKKGI